MMSFPLEGRNSSGGANDEASDKFPDYLQYQRTIIGYKLASNVQ